MRLDTMILAVDAHACGEPGPVIVGGVLDVPGGTLFDKKNHLKAHRDELRTLMLQEPRGYPALCCNLIVPPVHPDADAGFIIMEQTEYPAMSGSNTICVATVLLETGMVAAVEPITELTLESPAGLITVRAEVSHGKVRNVTFENVPAFAVHLDETVEVPELGEVKVDVAYGGMFYTIADAESLKLELVPENGQEIARGRLPLQRDFVHEGILGTTFTGRLVKEIQVGPYQGLVPTISGSAWITGFSQYVVDPEDLFPDGFTIGDIWG
jgi:proline racemase